MKVVSLSGKVYEEEFKAENRTVLGNKVWVGSTNMYTTETKIALKKRIKALYPSVNFYPNLRHCLNFVFLDSAEEAQFALLASSLEIDCRNPI